MAHCLFWDEHLLFALLPGYLQSKDKEDISVVINPVFGALAEDITSIQQTIKIVPAQMLDSEGFLYIGTDNVGVEKIYYQYDIGSNPYYLTNCVRNYDGKGSSAFSIGSYLYTLPKAEGQLSRFLRILEPSFDTLYEHATQLVYLKNPQTCPQELLNYLAEERGWTSLDLTKDVSYQRKFISFLPEIYKNKGTKKGLVDLIYLIGGIKGQVFNYWDFSFFIEETYGCPSYISISAVTGDPDHPRIYQVRAPILSTDYNEVRKMVRYSRPACQVCEILWTLFFDNFSTELSYWSLGSVSKLTYSANNTLILERGV